MQLDMQKMLESKIVYLQMENKLQKTNFMQTEAAYLTQLQALSSSNDELQKKLESKCREIDHFDWKALIPEMIANMIQDAKEMADNHLKIAQEKLVEAQSELQMLRASDGLLLISAITKEATAAIEEKVRTQIKASFDDFQITKENLKSMKSQEINKNDLEDIKAAIKMVRSIEDHLKWLKSEKINEDDEKKIQDAIMSANHAVQSIENIINNGI
ncbi:uncharacterized protein LOC144560715 [Carex rostrata]